MAFLVIDVPSMLVDSGLPDDKVAMLPRETAVVAAVAAAVAAALHEAVPEGMVAVVQHCSTADAEAETYMKFRLR